MVSRSAVLFLSDIVEAIERIRSVTKDIALDSFKRDWQKRWIVERGIEIVSEASRRLPDEFKNRHAEIPWRKIAAIGNIFRHEYERISPTILWNLARQDIAPLEEACRAELLRLQER